MFISRSATTTWLKSISLFMVALFLGACSRTTSQFPEAEFSDMLSIAPLNEALTFARAGKDGDAQLWAIQSMSATALTGVNLTKKFGPGVNDPVKLFLDHGYEALRSEIESGFAESGESLEAADLVLPLDLTDSHVAVGTNFPEHAQESDVQEGPFLFAKEVTPSPFRAPVSAGEALLDYEVELAFVTLNDSPLPGVPQYMGLILANDFTDRALLMRNLDPNNVTSGKGFTTGKSKPGYLPLGNLFVIPRDLDAFVSGLKIRLAVNGKLRQEAPMTDWIWDIHEIFRQTETAKDVRWKFNDAEVGLPVVDGALPARTLILAGTPDGTVFQGIPKSDMARGVLRWLAFGWNRSLPQRVIERTIKSAKKKGNYLKAGDEVLIQVDRMGTIQTPVVD